jgi:serine/threonine protein kinase
MNATRVCPECKGDMPADAPDGLCSQCAIVHAVATIAQTPPPDPNASTATFRGHFIPPTPEQLAGHFAQLEILQLVGEGGMGAVYKARQPGLDRLVALKILPAEAGRDPTFTERFTREARALARLNHPNIITIYDFGQAGDLYYFLMEFVDGANLRQLLRGGFLRTAEAMKIVPQICDALQYAHEEGLVHRDIKPENILLDKKGRVKVADFGIAKLLDRKTGEQTLTGPWQVMGTMHYMAPEQMADPLCVDHRADLYSLGVVFYEMLTGQLPLGRFAPPSQKVALDVRLDEVVLHALESEPARRYQHASEIRTDVETIARGSATQTTTVEGAEHPWQEADLEAVRRKTFWPALTMLLSGIFSLLPSIAIPIIWIVNHGQLETWQAVTIILIIISTIMGGVSVWGGVRLSRLEWLPFVTFASIVAMVPFTAGWLVGFPAGLWAFIILRDPKVIAAFKDRPWKRGTTSISPKSRGSRSSTPDLRASSFETLTPRPNLRGLAPDVRFAGAAASPTPVTPIPQVTPVPSASAARHSTVGATAPWVSKPAPLGNLLVRNRLRGPKIALAATGILNLVASKNYVSDSFWFGLPSVSGLSLAAAILILIGALRWHQLRSYELVRWACIATLIPFVSPTFPLSLAAGIWCLSVLNKPEIKAAFKTN